MLGSSIDTEEAFANWLLSQSSMSAVQAVFKVPSSKVMFWPGTTEAWLSRLTFSSEAEVNLQDLLGNSDTPSNQTRPEQSNFSPSSKPAMSVSESKLTSRESAFEEKEAEDRTGGGE